MARQLARVAVLIAVATVLAALTAAASPTPAAAATSCGGKGDTSPGRLGSKKARAIVLCLINRKREKAGLRPFVRDRRLDRAAQSHSDRMDGTGCFAHQCPGEPPLAGRLKRSGYPSRYVAEIIGWGYRGRGSPREVLSSWLKSPGHRANILSRRYREIGIGFARGTPSRSGATGGIYTIDFGLRGR